MVNYCVAVGCKNRTKKGSGISFFLFPHKDPQRLNQWVHAIRRKDWKPSVHSCICSDHFEEKCFVVRPGCEGRKLTQNAVPTIFPMFPTYYQKPMNAGRQKSPQKREYIPPQEFTPDCEPSPSKVQKSILKWWPMVISLQVDMN